MRAPVRLAFAGGGPQQLYNRNIDLSGALQIQLMIVSRLERFEQQSL